MTSPGNQGPLPQPQGTRPEDYYLLLSELLGCGKAELSLRKNLELDGASRQTFSSWLDRLQDQEPPQYILGKAWFYGLELEVGPGVLIPRPETEGLVELALSLVFPKAKVLDIGTGCGAIALALKTQRPDLLVSATDISAAALDIASRNAFRHGCDIEFHPADLFSAAGKRFHLIISNPPYISPQEYSALEPMVRDFEPREALLAQEDGLEFYHRILNLAPARLAAGGRLLFEHGDLQRERIIALAQSAGFDCFLARDDLAGRNRYLGFCPGGTPRRA